MLTFIKTAHFMFYKGIQDINQSCQYFYFFPLSLLSPFVSCSFSFHRLKKEKLIRLNALFFFLVFILYFRILKR